MSSFLLHYVGGGLYDEKVFQAEASRLGVNRAFPSWIVRQAKIEFGSPVLLAKWEADPALCTPVDPTKSKAADPSKARKKQGYSTIFGYFTVDGVSVAGSSGLKDKIKDKLSATEKQVVPIEVVRECGIYTIYAVVETNRKLADILKAFEEAHKEANGEGKIFLSGKFYPLLPTRVGPTGFSRAGALIGFNEALVHTGQPQEIRQIAFLGEYERRTYLPKAERDARKENEKINGFAGPSL